MGKLLRIFREKICKYKGHDFKAENITTESNSKDIEFDMVCNRCGVNKKEILSNVSKEEFLKIISNK